MVLGISFLSLNNINVEFVKLGKLTWKLYTVAEALPTTSWVKLISKREFALAALNKNSGNFVMYVSALEAMTIHPFRAAQIVAL